MPLRTYSVTPGSTNNSGKSLTGGDGRLSQPHGHDTRVVSNLVSAANVLSGFIPPEEAANSSEPDPI